jgi:hypothetical protein
VPQAASRVPPHAERSGSLLLARGVPDPIL